MTKICYQTERPGWLVNESAMADDWSLYLQTLEGHNRSILSVAWSPDGSQLASASYNKTDSVTGWCISTLERYSSFVTLITWLLDGGQLVLASDNETIRIWDPATS
ncbi:hypothetical protein N7541_003278 [Penicillium brevicompactum]|uniref:Anaphase-promoting complex subunit 4 WD40 domain-containing protein n=1 Tax=Penicillium brevicompactum TaxID=5074 RepID=A0A9W9RP26_PENBR|nr:hypothetical protein N7541_003278 [Penicillium brevicompactum]